MLSSRSLTTISLLPSFEADAPSWSGNDAHTSVKVPPLSIAILMDLSGSSAGELLRGRRADRTVSRADHAMSHQGKSVRIQRMNILYGRRRRPETVHATGRESQGRW